MFRYSFSWYIFTFTLLESIIKTHLTAHDGSHGEFSALCTKSHGAHSVQISPRYCQVSGFISNNQRYFDNDLGAIHEEIASGIRSGRITNDANIKLKLKFEPAHLDFKHRPLGVPHLEKVTLFNIDRNKSIDMTSISGSTVHFHSSFFEDKKIPPLGNTSFNVVFLGREEGFVESNLFIHTTEGHFKYSVKGSSIFSPYRLRPIVGIKLPVNASFSPLIYMHNPHTQPIQIVEVYSSGGDFHLELPSGELEGPKEMWEIPPLQTKAVIRVRFQAKTEQNHTAYVRIKVNSTEEVLVVPLEVEVSSGQAGIFDPQGSIDFGVGGSLDAPKQADLCVFNPLKKPVRIHSVLTSSHAIKVSFEHVKLMPANSNNQRSGSSSNNINGCVKIGTLTLNWKTAFKNGDYSGKITVKYKNGKGKTDIPYYLTVLEGGLSYDPLTTRYFINDKPESLSARAFKVKNNFLSSVRLINFTLPPEAQKFFKIENYKPLVLKPQQESNILTIKLKNAVKLSELKVNSFILLKTNISDISIPLLSYNGKLQVHLPFKSKDYSLDLGLIGVESSKEIHFLVYNTNPVSITVKNVKTTLARTKSEIIGCGRDDPGEILLQTSFQNLTKCAQLKTDEFAIVRIFVQTPPDEGQFWGDVQIETQYENMSLPVHFKVANGKLEIGPDRLVFDQCFPGKICSHPLRVHSTFGEPMIIEDIVSLPPDERLSSKHSGHILAKATKVIGHLYLDPTVGCGTECYTGLQHDTSAQWLKTLALTESIADFDLNLVNTFYNRYLNVTANGSQKWQNLTLRLDTSEVRGHIFKTRVKMSWPSLLLNTENKSVFAFPLTQIGNVSYRNITIRNPSSYNLVVQIVLDLDYPDLQLITEGLPASFIPGEETPKRPSRTPQHGFFLVTVNNEENLSFGDVDIISSAVLLSPGENFTFSVGFRSRDTNVNSALIFLRNNLTIVEAVRVRAQGAVPAFKFGNRKPGSGQPLSFELTEKHLKDCEREKQYRHPAPNLTVKRSFTARNIGDVPIHVNSFHINDVPCEGYGFKVLNCAPFVLPPNATRKIDIAFTPDLTLSRVTRLLILDTSLNLAVNYTLHTTIPPYYLSLCAGLVQRPSWETYLSYVTISFMFLLFAFISFLALMDADRIKKQTMGALMAPSNFTTQPVLDLRLVGQQTRAEIRSISKSDESSCKKDADKTKLGDVENPVKTHKDGEKFEKYTALIPATGKSKKKLAKKNSGAGDNVNVNVNHVNSPDSSQIQNQEAQRKLNEVQSHKSNKSKGAVDVKIDEERNKAPVLVVEPPPPQHKSKTPKNPPTPVIPSNSKKVTKISTTVVPVYEEETSSTTTDCSSNNDDNDKENDQRNSKFCSKKKCDEQQGNKQPHAKIERRKSNTKQSPRESNNLSQNNATGKSVDSTSSHSVRKPHKGNGKTKEKHQNLHPHSGKNLKSNGGNNSKNREDMKRDSPSIRVSPPVSSQTPVWGENRATFSDVVARTETSVVNPVNIANTRPLSQTQTSKPTMYVEPYKQNPSPTELGPIGSRRIDFWSDDVLTAEDQSNSYFSNAYDLPPNANFLEDFVSGAAETWGQDPGLMGLINADNNSDVWNQNLASNSYWNPMYSPLAENLMAQQQQQQQPQEQPPQAPPTQSGYLWGASPVWAPWTPASNVPKTPTRTPPGFDAFEQRKLDDSPLLGQQQGPGEVYDYNPFGTANIWTQQQQQQQQQQNQPNPWNFSGP